MSLLARHECPVCFGYTGWVGDRARANPRRAHLACTCEEEAEERADLDPKERPDGRWHVAA